MAVNVVPIRDGQPSLRDMAGWLRRMADEIDACETNDVMTLVLLHSDLDGALHSRCFGNNPSRAEVVGMFQMAAIKTATGDWGGE